MQLRHFVSGSAALLTAWLVVTFIHKVPTQRYARPESRPATSLNDSASPTLRSGPVEAIVAEDSVSSDSELVRVSDSQ